MFKLSFFTQRRLWQSNMVTNSKLGYTVEQVNEDGWVLTIGKSNYQFYEENKLNLFIEKYIDEFIEREEKRIAIAEKRKEARVWAKKAAKNNEIEFQQKNW